MKIGAVLTVKNEAQLLRSNILYHRHVGVSEFYVFLDGTTDNTAEAIEDLGVSVRSSVQSGDLDDLIRNDRMLKSIISQLGSHVCARIMFNAYWAAGQARAGGCDWLLFLDADELFAPIHEQETAGSLSASLSEVGDETEMVIFRTVEALQRPYTQEAVFASETIFKNIFAHPGREKLLERRVWDPFQKKIRFVTGYIGHKEGKSAVRLREQVYPETAHRFRGAEGRRLKREFRPFLMHYNTYSFEDFVKKYKNHRDLPNQWMGGQPTDFVPYQMWRDLVNSDQFTDSDLKEYYEKWVAFSQEETDRLLAADPSPLARIEFVREAMKSISESG